MAAVRYCDGFSPLSSRSRTPITGSPNVMNRLQTLVMAMPVVAAAELTLYPDNIAYCTPRPTAPPAGTALEIVNDVWRTTNAGLYFRPGIAAISGNT